jgi:GTPase SAR1 family protein
MANGGKDYDLLFKVLVVGDTGCGRISLVNRFVNDAFDETSDCKNKALQSLPVGPGPHSVLAGAQGTIIINSNQSRLDLNH